MRKYLSFFFNLPRKQFSEKRDAERGGSAVFGDLSPSRGFRATVHDKRDSEQALQRVSASQGAAASHRASCQELTAVRLPGGETMLFKQLPF